jgi:hypothetical protein
MNERERWIVYPLLFFALGAALRDKFTHQVRTDDLYAGKVWCEELNVIDSEKPDRVVARLRSNPPERGKANQERFGMFVLIDSENRELCHVTNNQLFVNQIACKNLAVVDPQNPLQHLAVLTHASVRTADGKPQRLGSLLLTDSTGRQHFGLVDDQIVTRRIMCEGVAVVDPADQRKTLAGLWSEPVRLGRDGKIERVGVVSLNGQIYGEIEGTPMRAPVAPKADQTEESSREEDGPSVVEGRR